jgi:hypothetical protein
MRKQVVLAITVLIATLVAAEASAIVPDLLPMQGVLTDELGTPIDGPTDMVFRVYSTETGSTVLWSESYTGSDQVDVVEGFFTIYLGSLTPLNFAALLTYPELWLGVTVGTDAEMARVRIGAVPFAQEAQVCSQVGSLTETDINTNFATVTHNHDAVYAPISHTHAASAIVSGTLDNARFGAYSDITAEGYLDNNAGTDLLTRDQADARYGGASTHPIMATNTSAATTYLTTTCQQYSGAQVTVTVPAAGTIVVEALAYMVINHTSGTEDYVVIGIADTTTSCDDAYSSGRLDIPSGWPTDSDIRQTITTRRAYAVTAGTYTYYLNGYIPIGYAASTDEFWFASMDATFIPS